jgi:hypothetical protein
MDFRGCTRISCTRITNWGYCASSLGFIIEKKNNTFRPTSLQTPKISVYKLSNDFSIFSLCSDTGPPKRIAWFQSCIEQEQHCRNLFEFFPIRNIPPSLSLLSLFWTDFTLTKSHPFPISKIKICYKNQSDNWQTIKSAQRK